MSHGEKFFLAAECLQVAPFHLLGGGRFATDLQGRIQMSEGDPRTWIFHQMLVTAGYTACNVNGVLNMLRVCEFKFMRLLRDYQIQNTSKLHEILAVLLRFQVKYSPTSDT